MTNAQVPLLGQGGHGTRNACAGCSCGLSTAGADVHGPPERAVEWGARPGVCVCMPEQRGGRVWRMMTGTQRVFAHQGLWLLV